LSLNAGVYTSGAACPAPGVLLAFNDKALRRRG